MEPSLPPAEVQRAAAPLRDANLAFARRYPGESGAAQPVHTVYSGAQHFRHDVARTHGAEALRALEEHAPDPDAFARAVGAREGAFAETVYARVLEKLRREPVEDFRIDFEDGYGSRPDTEEDDRAVAVAGEIGRGIEEGTLPASIGLRLKPLNEEWRARSVRTLDLLLTALLERTGGELPETFLVTLPKVTVPEQAAFASRVMELLERRHGLAEGTLRYEVMVEVPQAVLGASGASPLPAFVHASGGRMIAAHFGTYDYTAGLGITPAHQRMRHPACDFARHVMQVTLAGTGVWLSDGSTAVLPVPAHPGDVHTAEQTGENRERVHRAWRMHYEDVRHSLTSGFYQGWDLHPAQLPTRFAAVFAFFLEGRDAAADRLRNFLAKASQATLLGADFDDAATGQALLNYFLRGVGCGAFSEGEVVERTGLTVEELRGRSFVKILRERQG